MLLNAYLGIGHTSILIEAGDSENSTSPTPYLAELEGKRFVVVGESKETGSFNETQMKTFTGDKIKARALQKDPVQFIPTFKTILCTNNKPDISQQKAVWDRLLLIEFNCNFTDDVINKNDRKKDYTFTEKLLKSDDELEWFFLWLIQGAIKMKLTEDIRIPQCVKDSTLKYKKDQDKIGDFVSDRIEYMKDNIIKSEEIYLVYTDWIKENYKENGVKPNTFYKEVKSKLEDMKGEYLRTNGRSKYKHLKIRNDTISPSVI